MILKGLGIFKGLTSLNGLLVHRFAVIYCDLGSVEP